MEMEKTTTIRAQVPRGFYPGLRSIEWKVPSGFGRHYAKCARDPASIEVLRDILGLVGYDASEAYLRGLTLRERVELEVHAAREHASASDVPVRRHPRPSHLPPPWRGKAGQSDSPTLLRAPTERG